MRNCSSDRFWRITDTFSHFPTAPPFFISQKRLEKPCGILSRTGTWKSIEKEDFLLFLDLLWSIFLIDIQEKPRDLKYLKTPIVGPRFCG
jgi:hypothetical protein